MEFHQIQSSAKIQLHAYQSGKLTINGEAHTQHLIALPDRLIEPWSGDYDVLKTLDAEIILMGTGVKLIFPETDVMQQLRAQGLAVEFMDTAAACRTFQILTSENRKVAAALRL